MPQEDNQQTNKIPTIQYILQHQILYQERHNLGKALEVFPNETLFIFAYVLSIEAGSMRTIGIDTAEVGFKSVHQMQLTK